MLREDLNGSKDVEINIKLFEVMSLLVEMLVVQSDGRRKCLTEIGRRKRNDFPPSPKTDMRCILAPFVAPTPAQVLILSPPPKTDAEV